MTNLSNRANLTVYKASAGSGKTFTLAVRYIALLIDNPMEYQHILAVTFTNKATGEMKQRILSQLYGIGYGLKESDGYLNAIRNHIRTTKSDAEIRQNALMALTNILNDYSHFRIETIDSFLQSILHSLARELQLGSGLTLELDVERVINKAVEEFLLNIESGSEEMNSIIAYIDENIDNESSWYIDKSLKDFSKQLFQESYLEKSKLLENYLNGGAKISDFKRVLNAIDKRNREREEEISELAASLFELSTNPIIASHIKSNGSKMFEIVKTDIKKLSTNITYQRCLNRDEEALLLKSGVKLLQSDSYGDFAKLCNEIFDRIAYIEKRREEYITQHNTHKAAREFINQLILILSVRRAIDKDNKLQGRFLLADTPYLLSQLKEGDTSFVFEKTGSFITHIMIDEFQDTSRLQWNNLKSLLSECLAQGKECLIVGDVKQSIYRWRNGDWEILNSMESIGPTKAEIITLDSNYRSYNNIIDFNNTLFCGAKALLNNKFKSQFNDPNDHIFLMKAYSDVVQRHPKDLEGGYINIVQFKKDKEIDSVTQVCTQLKESLEMLVAKGVRLGDITILFREKRHIADTCRWFASNAPEYKLISNEAYTLDSSPTVRIIIYAMRCVANSEDRISKIALATECAIYIDNNCTIGDDNNSRIERLNNMSYDLLHQPLYEIADSIYRTLELGSISGQDKYLFSFMDQIKLYTKRSGNDIYGFLSEWEERLHNQTIAMSEEDSINVMTVHKSKGLEFHTVIIPFCNWGNNHREKIWVEPTMEPYNTIPLLPIQVEPNLQHSLFSQDYKLESMKSIVDNLNLLYVATTRAVANLIIISHQIAFAQGEAYDIIEDFLQHHSTDNDGSIYIKGDIVASSNLISKDKSSNPMLQTATPKSVAFATHPLRVSFKQSANSSIFLDNDKSRGEYIERGKLYHYILSSINTCDDIESVVAELTMQGVICSVAEAERIERFISRAIDNPKARDWFSGRYRLYNENAIIGRRDGNLFRRIPDRVMALDNRIEVVDFKFAAAKDEHIEQVREYMALLREMNPDGSTTISGYVWYLYNNQIIEC